MFLFLPDISIYLLLKVRKVGMGEGAYLRTDKTGGIYILFGKMVPILLRV